ncbi:ricin-type beta-trefoil lectin domain protein [Hymenobacter terrigena]
MKKLYRPVFTLVAAGVLLPIMAFRPAHTQANEPVSVWLTTGDQTKLLQAQAGISFSASTPATGTTITVDESQTYQTIDGFGASMTGASAYLLNQKMSAAQRDALLTDLFGASGIHLSFLRHTMGGSDFSAQGDFTYDDRPQGQTDVGLSSFSIANDLVDLVPMLQAALAKNSSLKILGTPWSAPAWMKEPTASGVYELRNGHFLNTAYYQAYANYFVKYVQAYAAQGLPIYAVTLQNEPLFAASYMSMRMDAGNQLAFLKNNIGPAFQTAGLNTKLIVYDHNWDQPTYPNTVFADATAAQYAAGSAFHGYAGSVSGQSTTHNAYPAEDIWFTEISGTVGSSFAGDLKWHASNIIIGTTRNWAKSALEWNLALDQNNGPTNGGCTNCRGVVTINSTTGAVTRNVEYYALAHASKFVDPGAVRVGSNSVAGGIETVAFRNPDGSKVLIALNNSNASNTFKVSWNGQSFNYTLPAGALATYKWNTSDITLGRIYEISAKHSGKALEIVGSSTSNGGQAQQRTWATGSNQKWKTVDMGNGFVRLVNIFSNKSLDVPGPSTANGALAQQWDWTSNDSQAWLVQRQSDGTYRIINKYSNKALDVTSASQADGANAQQWDWTGADNQRWWFSDQGPAALTALAATGSAAAARLQVYPTTISQELTFDYTAETAETLQVQLVDVLGRVALAPPAVAAKAGLTHVSLNVASARPGLYVLKVRAAAGPLSQRVIIAR